MTVVLHPPYSPDLTPCDFALFPKLKIEFDKIEMIQEELLLVPSENMTSRMHLENLQYHWDQCLSAEGEYFEGNGIFRF